MSAGEGRKSTTASRSGWIPLFLKAAPQQTGTTFMERVCLRRAATISPGENAAPSRYFCMIASSTSARDSMSFSRAARASSWISAGMSRIENSAPRPSTSYIIACMAMRSTMPRNFSSAPTGIWTGTALAPNRSRIISTAFANSAPTRSILLMKAMRGTR